MTDLREKIRAELLELWDDAHREGGDEATAYEWGSGGRPSEKDERITEATGAIMAEMRVRVKPLEWPVGEPNTRMHSVGVPLRILGVRYFIARAGEGAYRWGIEGNAWSDICTTLDEAKTDCQRDYKSRILSCLEGATHD